MPVTCFLDRFDNPAKKKPIFRNVLDIDARQFLYPEGIYAINRGNDFIPDEKLLRQFLKSESVFLSISDRFSIGLSVLERKRLFHELLRYFYSFLQGGAYQAIIFPNAPHGGWNSVLYFVAKHLGVRTLVLEYTRINDRMVVWEDYEKVHKVPADYLAGLSREEVIGTIDTDLYREVFGTAESEWMKDSNSMNVAALSHLTRFREGALRAKQLMGAAVTALHRRMTGQNTYDRRPMMLNDPQLEMLTVMRWHRAYRKYRELRSYYDRQAKKPDLSVPYVLYFLNYQPEKTTTPLGGVYEDQVLALETLAGGLPQGWRIYVKEHPRQFSGVLDSVPYRDKRFYDRIAGIPGVTLLPVNMGTQEVLKSARATATITGSIGWQGMLQGRPCILFGMSWYSPCRSCFNVKSVDDVREALAEIQRQASKDVELDVLRYLAHAGDELLVGSNNEKFAKRSRRSLDELAERLADGLASRLRVQDVVYEQRQPAPAA